MQEKEFIYLLRNYRFHILAVILLSLSASSYYVMAVRKGGFAEAKFMVNNSEYYTSPSSSLGFAQTNLILTDKAQIVSQMTFILSDDMMNFLIKKFDLYNYYHINENAEGSYQILREIIIDNMEFNDIANGIITMRFKEKNSRMAADIVNATLENLERINKSFVLEKLNREVAVYNKLIVEGEKEVKNQKDSLKWVLDNVMDVRKKVRASIVNDELDKDQIEMFRKASEIETVDLSLINAKKMNSYAAELMNDYSSPMIRILNRAYPEQDSLLTRLLITGVTVLIISTTIYIFFLYHYTLFKDHLKIIFGK
jgi:hypothetical protein